MTPQEFAHDLAQQYKQAVNLSKLLGGLARSPKSMSLARGLPSGYAGSVRPKTTNPFAETGVVPARTSPPASVRNNPYVAPAVAKPPMSVPSEKQLDSANMLGMRETFDRQMIPTLFASRRILTGMPLKSAVNAPVANHRAMPTQAHADLTNRVLYDHKKQQARQKLLGALGTAGRIATPVIVAPAAGYAVHKAKQDADADWHNARVKSRELDRKLIRTQIQRPQDPR